MARVYVQFQIRLSLASSVMNVDSVTESALVASHDTHF
jgi:hypothetical protein